MLKNKITISGHLGSGKTVLAKKLQAYLSYEILSVGGIQRKLAMQYGMDTTTFNKYMETHPEIDIECDNMVSRYGKSDEPLILDSRLAWHFVPHAFKIHLIVSKTIAGKRIFGDTVRENEKHASIEDTIRSNYERRKSEVMRFKKQYGVDIDDIYNYDLVLDTSYVTPDEVFECVKNQYLLWQNGQKHQSLWLSPKNLFPTRLDDNELHTGADIVVSKANAWFFIQHNHKKVSEGLKNNLGIVPCQIDKTVNSNILANYNCEIAVKWANNHGFVFDEFPSV
ncbi:MAG TPA: cytidylate kinase family protein [Bacteroidales bacterium]|nr:cytidylate kinase family protein [Bacteroidales bacterium]